MHNNPNDEWWWVLAIKVKLKPCDYHSLFELQLTFQPTDVLTTQLWAKLTERVLTLHPTEPTVSVTTRYLWDGIVLRELQGQKCQLRQWEGSAVMQSSQAGWMALNLQWRMVK